MDNFNFSKASDLSKYIRTSSGKKFGEHVTTIESLNDLNSKEAEFVIFGVPTILHSEYNFSLKSIKFESLLESLLNIEHNQFNNAEDLIILGEIDLDFMTLEISDQVENTKLNQQKVKDIYDKLQDIIMKLVTAICDSGKTPIVLGGNFKNSIDVTKAISVYENKSLNLLDFSPKLNSEHQNLEQIDLSQLLETGNLKKYHAFGAHKNHSTQEQLDLITSSKVMNYLFYEDCLHLTTLDKCVKFKNAIDFLNGCFGFSFNLHSMQNISSLPESASGFSMRDIRTFMKVVRKEKIDFFHLSGFENCEKNKVSSIISYLISDFIRNED